MTLVIWRFIIGHMTQLLGKDTAFQLVNWEDVAKPEGLRVAYKQKRSWVIHSPRSAAALYATVLSNLRCQEVDTESTTIETIREIVSQGVDRLAVERLKQLVNISNEELADAIGMSIRTLTRREHFHADESDRLLRVASAFQRTLDLFDDLEKSRKWFATPKRALGGKTPLEYCKSSIGAEEVGRLLGRIEHGVFT